MTKMTFNPFQLLCRMSRIYVLLLFSLISSSCSRNYNAFKSQYTFKNNSGGIPDYSNLDYWAAHPWKQDPSDSIPKPLRGQLTDSAVDVFFLYPTTYTKKGKPKNQNATIDDAYINAKTDYSAILYQASVFNQSCRIFSPRYRQAHISTFFINDSISAENSFAIAYADIKAAFEYYLKTWNHNRPIIIASHSQGSKMAELLLKEFFENKPLQKSLVVAYIIGWPVPKDYFTALKMCRDSLQTGCICSWRTFRKGYVPYYLKNENGNSYVTNPLTWKTDEEYGPQKLNKGSVLANFNKVYKQTTDAQISHGFLYVKKPRFSWSFLYFRKNYHVADVNFFYLNLRENISQRIVSFQKQ